MSDEIERAEQAWQALCDSDGKETIEMAEPRDLFQMGFNAGLRAALAERSERERALREALEEIAQCEGLTLIAPSAGPDGDHQHQVGANKAFNQCADIAKSALLQKEDS